MNLLSFFLGMVVMFALMVWKAIQELNDKAAQDTLPDYQKPIMVKDGQGRTVGMKKYLNGPTIFFQDLSK